MLTRLGGLTAEARTAASNAAWDEIRHDPSTVSADDDEKWAEWHELEPKRAEAKGHSEQ
jgi:hypothetical protein